MNIIEKSNEFLRILSIVSNENSQNKISGERLRKLLDINRNDFPSIIHFLKEKGRIILLNSNNDVSITATGIEAVYELKKGKKFVIVGFLKAEHLPTSRDGNDFIFYYNLIKNDGTISERNRIKVGISGSLEVQWNYQLPNENIYDGINLEKILFQYAKNTVFEKLREGTLNQYEEMTLLTGMYGDCLYKNVEDLIEPVNLIYEIEINDKGLVEQIEENKLAPLIIEKRDVINARFNSLHNMKLFSLTQERDLLNLFKDANTEEEFTQRILSLANVVQSLNIEGLKTLNKNFDKSDKSINLLEKYLKEKYNGYEDIIKIFRSIVDIRNGFPIHTDSDDKGRLLSSYKYLELDYPIKNFNKSWMILLSKYNDTLNKLDNILSKTH